MNRRDGLLHNPGPNDGVSFHFISGQQDVRDGFNAEAKDYGVVFNE